MPRALFIFTEQLQKLSLFFSSQFNGNKKEKESAIVPSSQSTNMEEIISKKCHFCDRCQLCQTTFEQNQIKDKRKKTIEAKWNTLHSLIFFCIFLLIFISDLIVWIVMSK